MVREREVISRRAATNEVNLIPFFISITSRKYRLYYSSLISQVVFYPLIMLAGKMPLGSGWEF
jgi:hypothetical protein